MECSVSFEGYIIKGKPVKKWSCMIDSFTNATRNSSRKIFWESDNDINARNFSHRPSVSSSKFNNSRYRIFHNDI